MLAAIRNKSKGWVAYLIVGLIVIPFALFGIQDYVSRSANASIATVDGEDIDIKVVFMRGDDGILKIVGREVVGVDNVKLLWSVDQSS